MTFFRNICKISTSDISLLQWLNAVVCIWLIESSRKLLAQRLNRLALSFFITYKKHDTPNKCSCQSLFRTDVCILFVFSIFFIIFRVL
nr:MAG TPA: hypothetical protein [Caudoviricetes sp.]